MTETPTPPATPTPPPAPARRTSGMAIAALICGIGAFTFLPIVGGVAALVLGYSARDEMRRNPELDGEGYATAGIVLGWIAVALAAFGFLLVVLFGCAVATGGSGVGP